MTRHPVLQNADRRHQIQAQQSKIGQVVLAEWLVAKMGMDHTNTPQRAASETIAGEVRQQDFAVVPDNDILHCASAIDQHRDLTSDFMREFGAKPRQLLGDDSVLQELSCDRHARGGEVGWALSR